MKRLLIVLSVLFCLGWLSDSVCSQSTDDADQSQLESQLKRFEVGGQFTILRRADADTGVETFRRFGFPSGDHPIVTEFGLGGRFTYNFTKNIAVEAEANFFPDDKRSNPMIGVPIRIIEPGGRKFQAVLGPKIGIRKKKFGAFAKVRPGLFSMDRYLVVKAVGTPTNFFVLSSVKKGVNFFSVDVGGVFEYYPTRRTILRFDAGDTIIHYNAQEPKEINPNITRHNLQISAGFGFRF